MKLHFILVLVVILQWLRSNSIGKNIIFFPPTYKLSFSVLIKLFLCFSTVKTFMNSLGELSLVAAAVFRN